MHIVKRRGLAASLALAMLILPTAGAAAKVTSGGDVDGGDGEVTGVACDLTLMDASGVPVDDHLELAIGQEFAALGAGYPSSTTISLDFTYLADSSVQPDSVVSDAAGEFGVLYYFLPGSEGEWRIDGYVPGAPKCGDMVHMSVFTGHAFTDISGHLFEGEITWLFQRGITTGCSSAAFCPDGPVTREQMASFLVRALGLSPTATDYYTDDESSIHESDINAVTEAGIATGCGGGIYCPSQPVAREQMASFLKRAFGFPTTPSDFFTDDETSIHEADINAAAALGIATGCGGGLFCPLGVVTRGQMAAFLERTFFSAPG